ncbi:MAG: hypothetical protein H6742_13675 [Alphaproteobacteria bacterium]|nr:hypothetical protein [Alphaproteobacteria bacterium]
MILPLPLLLLLPLPALADVPALLAYEDALDNVADGDWYAGSDNSRATLAWGQSYVMMSLAEAARGTGDRRYLDRLLRLGDDVLAQRDDARGVTDYRGVSAACWQNTHYQPEEQPYCYVVHSGMIALPLVEAALLVDAWDARDELAWDGTTWGEKADAFVAAAEEIADAHADQWNAAGYYVFRPDAAFLAYAGRDLPLNQSNAMGRLHVALWQATGDTAHRDKATALATRFRGQLSSEGGDLLWNYWGGTYSGAGEDISHAAINVDFAARCAEAGIVFDEDDLDGFAATFVDRVYVDDDSLADFIGGVSDGSTTDGSSYEVQAGRWLRLAALRPTVYTATRQVFDAQVEPGTVGSGSTLLGLAMLATRAPARCGHFPYYVDWTDPIDGWIQATAYGANVLAEVDAWDQPCMVRLPVDVPRATTVQQWDGGAYHDVARWSASGGETTRWVPYEPRWAHDYWAPEDRAGGALFQFVDSFVSGDGIRVGAEEEAVAPVITSTPPTSAEVGEALAYAAEATAAEVAWWSLEAAPTGARIDATTGVLTWTVAGDADFVLVVTTDGGSDRQAWTVEVPGEDSGGADGGGDSGTTDGGGGDSGGHDSGPADGGGGDDGGGADSGDTEATGTRVKEGGCGCAAGPASGMLWLAGIGALAVRRRRATG